MAHGPCGTLASQARVIPQHQHRISRRTRRTRRTRSISPHTPPATFSAGRCLLPASGLLPACCKWSVALAGRLKQKAASNGMRRIPKGHTIIGCIINSETYLSHPYPIRLPSPQYRAPPSHALIYLAIYLVKTSSYIQIPPSSLPPAAMSGGSLKADNDETQKHASLSVEASLAAVVRLSPSSRGTNRVLSCCL